MEKERELEGQEKENAMEDVEEGNSGLSPVAYSVGTVKYMSGTKICIFGGVV